MRRQIMNTRGWTAWLVILGTIVLSLGTIGYGLWLVTRPPVDTTVAVESKPAAAVSKVRKVTTKVQSVQTFAPEAKANLKLPPLVIADADKHVISATTVEPTERRMTVTSVLDTQTGETTTYTKPETYPWFAVESRGEARLDIGYKVDRHTLVPRPVGRLSVTHSFAQVKASHLGVNVAIDTDGTAFAGVGLSYRW